MFQHVRRKCFHHRLCQWMTGDEKRSHPQRWLSSSRSSSSFLEKDDEYSVVVGRNGVQVVNSNQDVISVSNGWLWRNAQTHTMDGTGQRTSIEPPPELDQVQLVFEEEMPTIPNPYSVHMLPTGEKSPDWWLQVSWKNNTKTCANYPLSWLQTWSSTNTTTTQSSSQVTNEDTFMYKYQNQIPQMSYDSVVQQKKHPLKLLDTLFQDGAVLLHNVPPLDDNYDDKSCSNAVKEMAELLGGKLSHGSLYGDVFHVTASSETKPNNIAYTNYLLPPHQDLVYYTSPPGFQILHCLSNSTSGGESILIDGLAAAHTYQQLLPNHYETLTSINATFVKQRSNAHMLYQRPHIVTTNNNNNQDIVSVNWAPPFEGPLSLSYSLQQQSDYDDAYMYFQQMVDKHILPPTHDNDIIKQCRQYAKEYTWEYKLQPGQMIIFNNQRMLHGRRAFQLNFGKRHFIGGYTDMDDTLNKYRVLLQQSNHANHKIRIPNVGNGTNTTFP